MPTYDPTDNPPAINTSSCSDMADVTPDGSDVDVPDLCKGLLIVGTGDLHFITLRGTEVTLEGVPAYSQLNVRAATIKSDSTATGIFALID